MRTETRSALAFLLFVGLSLPPVQAAYAQDVDSDHDSGPAVFVMTNSAERNEILAYTRNADGTLSEAGHFSTGGRGSGGNTDPLASQGSLTLTQSHSHLLAVNAGSGDITVFRVHGANLDFSDREPSGGAEPVAVAQFGDLVYVLNAAANSSVVGFHLHDGALTPIDNSLRYLTGNVVGPASIAFSPNGQFLAVTEKASNKIDVFPVQSNGTLGAIVTAPSVGPGLFSLAFAPNGTVITTETGAPGTPNDSATSSYTINSDGTLSVVSASLPTLGGANCWNEVTPDGRFVYFSNAGSANIAGFSIASNGALTALTGTIVGSNPAGATNVDLAISKDGKYLYSLNSGNGTVGIFAIQHDGTLKSVAPASGLTATAGFNGIAAN